MTLSLLLWESVLPFTLVFTLVYALLRKTGVLGKENKSGAIVVSLAVALTLVLLHAEEAYPSSFDPVQWINVALQYFGLALVLLLCTILLLALLGIEIDNRLLRRIILVVIVVDVIIPDTLVVALLFGGAMPDWADRLFTPQVIATLIGVVVFIALVLFVTYDAKAAKKRRKELINRYL